MPFKEWFKKFIPCTGIAFVAHDDTNDDVLSFKASTASLATATDASITFARVSCDMDDVSCTETEDLCFLAHQSTTNLESESSGTELHHPTAIRANQRPPSWLADYGCMSPLSMDVEDLGWPLWPWSALDRDGEHGEHSSPLSGMRSASAFSLASSVEAVCPGDSSPSHAPTLVSTPSQDDHIRVIYNRSETADDPTSQLVFAGPRLSGAFRQGCSTNLDTKITDVPGMCQS
ncbi:hypothetical protein GLOTRDRAFT_129392 [Gloeophyllum trabeum ATCC 11539]|uniref:Uncharacterized protein n=1 Tax=Gloeophyllum trabeum (strain ATCC 11539 / FP-39264 / Madison 617) TaxID=670483 RepID=S7Q502_GLOTA|nr:uncharacterized protein GLOTRDRAFT_129392 [Gloeophyllum trabeum ATCC 11539]EPQ55101.1 hypothetical protein GLOTRDRAFT_129392 [Gloeophyllum trabeum ATCC 11539]